MGTDRRVRLLRPRSAAVAGRLARGRRPARPPRAWCGGRVAVGGGLPRAVVLVVVGAVGRGPRAGRCARSCAAGVGGAARVGGAAARAVGGCGRGAMSPLRVLLVLGHQRGRDGAARRRARRAASPRRVRAVTVAGPGPTLGALDLPAAVARRRSRSPCGRARVAGPAGAAPAAAARRATPTSSTPTGCGPVRSPSSPCGRCGAGPPVVVTAHNAAGRRAGRARACTPCSRRSSRAARTPSSGSPGTSSTELRARGARDAGRALVPAPPLPPRQPRTRGRCAPSSACPTAPPCW